MSPAERAKASRQPYVNRENRFFWEGVAAGELRFQRCAECGLLRHPPRPMCSQCLSLSWDSQVVSGSGTIYSYVVVHQPRSDAFPEPHAVALVELREGLRFVSNVIDVDPRAIEIGMPVQAAFVEVEPGVVLPLFRPA